MKIECIVQTATYNWLWKHSAVSSLIHSLAYSFIGLQTIYAAVYFPSVYWNTACLRVDSGLEDDASSNYGKIAKAVGNIINRGLKVSLIDINKSGYMFKPDEETDTIIYGMKALNGVGGEVIQTIINNRPYKSFEDFMSKVKVNKTVMVSLIKSGAFDAFGDRTEIMNQYIWTVCEPKKRITLQNFNGLMERNLIPEEFNFQKRTFVFNKALKANCKYKGMYLIQNNYYDFYEKFFNIDLLEPAENGILAISEKDWKKQYDETMKKIKTYFKDNQQDILNSLNSVLFNEVWNKYASGNLSSWEMESLGFYYHDHELNNVNEQLYDIVEFNSLNEEPVIDYTFKRNGVEIPIFKTFRIMGTVVAKDDSKSSVSILTKNSGVVDVKFSRDYFAQYNKRISEIQIDGTKKVKEQSWFQKGTLIIVHGIRRGDMFFTKSYKKSASHQLYKIVNLYDNGTIDITNDRYEVEN